MIDWNRVEELREEIGEEDFFEVAGMFLEEADQTVEKLSRPMPTQETEALLHFLKGSALNLGLVDLAAICQSGERSAAAGEASADDVTRLIAVYRKSKTAFLAGSPKDSTA